MATAPHTTPDRSPAEPELTGWVIFAAAMLFLSAMFTGLWGLAAVLNDDVVTVGGAGVIVWDFTFWGWVHMALALAMLAVAGGLVALKGWARVGAIIFAMLNAVAQLTVITAFPLWAIVVIALDATVIYQLTQNWRPTDWRQGI